MKLLNYLMPSREGPHFGVVIDDFVVSFADRQDRFDRHCPGLRDIEAYLRNHPESEDFARGLVATAHEKKADFSPDERLKLDHLKVLPPVPRPPALIDFALAPEHLLNSGLTLVKHEKKWPVSLLLGAVLRGQFRRNKRRTDFRCYKGNHHAVIGDGDMVHWPSFTSYLDVEAELACVVGNTSLGMSERECENAIAGYTIFNDFSARDVQWPELMNRLGLARCKDFDRGNGIGPFLVTPDEVMDPLALQVSVKVGERYEWHGHTSGYTADPTEMVAYLSGYQTIMPGTVIGMGTVPGCCGLDHDEWPLPGDLIEITFDKLGTLRQPIPPKVGPLGQSRWATRQELGPFLRLV